MAVVATKASVGWLTAAVEAVYLAHMLAETPKKRAAVEPIDVLPPDEVLFGRSAVMAEVKRRAGKIAGANVPVLLCGPGGSGKEVLARWIHARSPWCAGLFVKVNCAAIPHTLLESELFGYEKGAFTGARISKPGRVELAHMGTLFLDEIGNLNLASQSKLLQFLQDGRYSRIGDETERVVETRLICATNKDLRRGMDEGTFRADLYHRINVVLITLPRLAERKEDIPLLAEYFRMQFEKHYGRQSEAFRLEMLRHLQSSGWPGNIRELSNEIARHVLIGAEARLAQEPTASANGTHPGASNGARLMPLKQIAKEAIRARERGLILEALQANQWNRRRAAEALKISYRALIYKIREAGLSQRGPRSGQATPAFRQDEG